MSANSQPTGPGGVRNLRAMFETKTTDQSTSTSPPSRGRSPADSEASLPSRALSKVRASFVAVERPGEAGQGQQWGLRMASDVQAMPEAREEHSNERPALENQPTHKETGQAAQQIMTNQTQDTGAHGSDVVAETESTEEGIPKFSPHVPGLHGGDASQEAAPIEAHVGLGHILKGSEFEVSPSEAAAAASGPQHKMSAIPKANTKSKPTAQSASMGSKMDEASKNPHPRPPPRGDFILNKKAISVLPPSGRTHPKISINSPTTPKSPSQKTPVFARNPDPKGPTKQLDASATSKKTTTTTPKLHAQTKAARAQVPPVSTKSTRDSKTASTADIPTSNGVKKEATPTPTPPSSKPRPRSPTRPTRLPAAAIAATSASAAKATDGDHQSSSRTSITSNAPLKKIPTTQPSKPVVRPPVGATASSLAKKTSRASLVSQSGTHDRPKSRMSTAGKPPAEGFLARLTRPTASFAQKTHEKLQVHSPPRERKSTGKSSSRKSLGKSEDGKEIMPEAIENGVAEGPDATAGGDQAILQKDETPAQPLAAGQNGADSMEETH